jgi:hypothetical protein
MRFMIFRNIALGATALFAAACSDQALPTGPDAAATGMQMAPRFLRNGEIVNVVTWSSGHRNGQYTTSGVIGRDGGRLTIPSADFTITFPRGALAANLTITIIAQPSAHVSYDMQPHGIQFARAVTVTQGLTTVNVPLLVPVFGAYMTNDSDQLNNGTAQPTETLQSTTLFDRIRGELVPVKQIWLLNHFSRYILASGATDTGQ